MKEQKADSEQRVREKHVLSQTLEGLVSLITIVTQRYKPDLVKFLTSLGTNSLNLLCSSFPKYASPSVTCGLVC